MWRNMTDDLNQIYSKQIEREDNLIGQRLTMLLTFQGFLFASLSLLGEPDAEVLIVKALTLAVPLMGIVISVLAIFGIHTAVQHLNELKNEWRSLHQEKAKRLPAPFWNRPNRVSPVSLYHYGIPAVSALTWLFLLLKLNCPLSTIF